MARGTSLTSHLHFFIEIVSNYILEPCWGENSTQIWWYIYIYIYSVIYLFWRLTVVVAMNYGNEMMKFIQIYEFFGVNCHFMCCFKSCFWLTHSLWHKLDVWFTCHIIAFKCVKNYYFFQIIKNKYFYVFFYVQRQRTNNYLYKKNKCSEDEQVLCLDENINVILKHACEC